MKVRLRILLCLLALVAAWCLWPRAGVVASRPEVSASAAAKIPAAATNAAIAKLGAKPSTAATNWLAFRLSNTPKTLKDKSVLGNPNFILLQNAIINTTAKMDLKIPAHLKAADEPGAFIVQARGAMDAAFRAALGAAGGVLVSYIPNNAELVQISSAGAAGLRSNPRVQAVLPWEPYYKVQSSLLGLAAEQEPLPAGRALTLGLLPGNPAATRQEIEQLGGKIIGTDESPFGPVLRVLAPENWTALAQVAGVQLVELSPRQRVTVNDLTRVTLGIADDSQTTTNWLNLSGSNVLVAVADSGIDATHPDLASRVTGYAAADLTDTVGHGTHVAGIIAGNGSKSAGVNAEGSVMPGTNGQFRGMAPLARLYAINYGHSDQFLQAAEAITNALIANNSWVYENDFEYDLAAASYDAATRDALPYLTGSQPMLYVFAAGNSGGGADDGTGGSADTILSPGTAKNVVTVGALEQPRDITNIVTVVTAGVGTNSATTNQSAYWQAATDSGSQVAAYSSRGNVGIQTEGDFGRFKPDVISPGTFVVSTRSSEWDTNTYVNITNVSTADYTEQFITPGALNYYNVSVPPNAVAVVITITSNTLSIPFPDNLPIYLKQSTYPTTNTYDILTKKNGLSIPADGGSSIATYQNNGFNFAVGDSTNVSVYYDVSVSIYTTNNVGDLYSVLLGMDNDLGPYYRYETGTSMAAANISGTLALLEDYFTNTLHQSPSPALLKAMLINGARPTGGYDLAVTNGVNFQGWGLPNLQGSLPLTNTTQPLNALAGSAAPIFFVDQSATNALATGDNHTYTFFLDTNNYANYLPLQATLVWSDPPGNPAAAIKLVNNLELVLTNLDTGDIYYGNDISSDNGYNLPTDTNSTPNIDLVNNVQNIILPPVLAGRYSVTVIGRAVNVNSVTGQTNNYAANGPSGTYAPNVVQDYALVVSVGNVGEAPTAITSVTDSGIISNPTGAQNITVVTTTNTPLFNQSAGANSPYLSTNDLVFGGMTNYGFYTNSVFHIGQTNQWHFYVVTNTMGYTNAAFITFLPNTLSIPREGVFAGSDANSTRPEASLQILVTSAQNGGIAGDSLAPLLTNLDVTVISNCLANANGDASAIGRAGTQFVAYTNSQPNQVYYIGVQCEDQTAAQFDFLPVFSQQPFSVQDSNGVYVTGLNLPVNIPDGNNAHPGIGYVYGLCLSQVTVNRVIVTNTFQHQNFGDLTGWLYHSGGTAVLNNHDGLGAVNPSKLFIYEDSNAGDVPGAQRSDGPGSLQNFQGKQGIGLWRLTEMDNSYTQTGSVTDFQMKIVPHKNFRDNVITVSVPAHGWFYDYIDVPVGYTNLLVLATNVTQPPSVSPPVVLYVNAGSEPTLSQTNNFSALTNGTPPSGFVSVGPPLTPGRYFVGLYNPSSADQSVKLTATLLLDRNAITVVDYNSTGYVPLADDAISLDPQTGGLPFIMVYETNNVQNFQIGLRVDHPRISDLVFHLISPDGTRYLLMENRGGQSTNGCGITLVTTNEIDQSLDGGAAAVTNSINVGVTHGTLPITYNFYTAPDEMTVYYGTNVSPAYLIYDTGMTNNPPLGPGAQNTQPETFTVSFPPPGVSASSTYLTIVMNQYGNSNSQTAWNYRAGGTLTNFVYLTFTEDTNLTTTPIQFAPPPFVPQTVTNSFLSTNISITYSNAALPANVILGPITNLENNHLYVMFQPTNWTTSEAWAEALGGHLATIRNAYEDSWVGTNFSNVGGVYYDQWIGLYDPYNDTSTNPIVHGGYFTWVSGEASAYRNWGTGEPDNGGSSAGAEHYTYKSVSGVWNDFTNLNHDANGLAIAGVAELASLPTVAVTNYIYATNFVVTTSNLYYLPEQDISGINGTVPYGKWQLEILDDRAGATNNANLLSWQMEFTFANTNITVLPVLPVIPDQANVIETTLMTVTNTALNATNFASLAYSLSVSGVTNASINSSNGVITWTPTEAQGPGSYVFVTTVRDPSNPLASSQDYFTVDVLESNLPPVITFPTSNTVFQITATLPFVTNAAAYDPDIPTNTLTFGFTGATNVSGPGISANDFFITPDGTIYWLPAATNAPSTNLVGITCTDFNAYDPVNTNSFTVTNYFTVVVLPVGLPPLTNGSPATNVVAPGGINWFLVTVPTNAIAATNALIFATSPVNFWFSTNVPPGTNLLNGDYEFAAGTIGSTNVITPSTVPVLVPGGVYYLGVQNPNSIAVTNAVEVTFELVNDLTNGSPATNVVAPGGISWFLVTVPANALAATNALLFAAPDVNLWFSTNVPPSITNSAAGDFELQTNSVNGTNVITPSTVPVLVPGGVYYLGVQNTNSVPAAYALQVTFEFPVTNFSIASIVHTNSNGTNGWLLTWFAPTNYQFHLQWTPLLAPATWKEMKGVISDLAPNAGTNALFQFFDGGDTNRNSAPFGNTRFYRLHLLRSPTNTAPEFITAPIGFNAAVGQPLSFTNLARDWDIPPQTLLFFVTNSLTGTNLAAISDTYSGVLTWTPDALQNGKTNLLTIAVRDNGVPAKTVTELIPVYVYPQPVFGGITAVTNGMQMTWSGSTNEQFQIDWTTNLVPPVVWTPFPPPPVTSTNGVFNFTDTNAPFTMKFYELLLLP